MPAWKNEPLKWAPPMPVPLVEASPSGIAVAAMVMLFDTFTVALLAMYDSTVGVTVTLASLTLACTMPPVTPWARASALSTGEDWMFRFPAPWGEASPMLLSQWPRTRLVGECKAGL